MPLRFRRKRKSVLQIDEYAQVFHAAFDELLDLPPDEEPDETFVRAQSARWDSLKTTTTVLESLQTDDRLTDVHKGVVGVFLGALNVLNCCNAMMLHNLTGDTNTARVWADRLEVQFPNLKHNAYYLQEQLRYLGDAYPSAYQVLGPTDEEYEGLRRRQVDLWGWIFSDTLDG